VVVTTTSTERVLRLVCPGGVYEGNVMQITVDGAPYFVTVPPGIRPGMTFDVRVPPPVVVKQQRAPVYVPPAAIVSDHHGSWTRLRYESINGAERAWSSLGFFYASVLFVLKQDGTFKAFKEYGTSSAVQEIKKKFHEQFKFDLFPELRATVGVATAAAPVTATVTTQPPPPPAYPTTSAAVPPAYPTESAAAPPSYPTGSAPPAYPTGSAPPAYPSAAAPVAPSAPPAYGS